MNVYIGAYRRPEVAFAGDAWTREVNERVERSLLNAGIARNSSKMPSG